MDAAIEAIISDFVAAAVRVKACGFDGVEIHGAPRVSTSAVSRSKP